eukprot:602771-Pleurochrysis_carterae.AAC.1
MRVPRRARLAEGNSSRLSPPSLVALFVALGGENSFVRWPRGAMPKQATGGSREREGRGRGRGERELRECNTRRCGAERRWSHWPSTTGANPVASSSVPPAMSFDCQPVRGSHTGVGVSVGGDGLSTSLPPATFAGSLPLRPLQCALRGDVRTGGKGTQTA